VQDPHVQFRIKRQHFLELLRAKRDADALGALPPRAVWERATRDGVPAAHTRPHARPADYLRRELAPFAATAYPEAYSELSDSLLCLLQPDAAAPAWQVDERSALAAFLHTALRLEGPPPPPLQLLLVYLALQHRRVRRGETGALPECPDLDACLAAERTRVPGPRHSAAAAPQVSSVQVWRARGLGVKGWGARAEG